MLNRYLQSYHYVPVSLVPIFDAHLLCVSGTLIGISACVLYALRCYTASFLSGVLFATTLNHWRDYRLGWRRRMDLWWVNLCILYTGVDLHLRGNEIQQFMYTAFVVCTFLFYRMSHSGHPTWIVFHMAIHLYVAFFIPVIYGLFV
jgi:hypothetical protein